MKRPGLPLALVVALLGALILVMPTAAASTTRSTYEVHSLASGADDEAVRFRTDFGLPTHATALASARIADRDADRFGVPITPAEAAEVERRFEMADDLRDDQFWESMEAHPEYAGGTIDQGRGGLVVVRFTGDLDAAREAVEATIPADIGFEVIGADRTLAALRSLQTTIDDASPSIRGRATDIISTYVDVESGEVVVGVNGLTDSERDWLEAEFGAAVRPVDDRPSTFAACTSRNSCAAPMKGGLTINASVGGACTSGFMGRPSGSFTHLYVLTAGHCLDATLGSGLAATWSHNGANIGAGAFEDLYNLSKADVGGINDSESGAKNRVYASGTADIKSITARASNGSQTPGTPVCRAGKTSGWDCGLVSIADVTRTTQGVTLYHQWRTSFSNALGDSGGPLLSGSVAFGIVSTSDGYYGTIDWINIESAVRPCYTAGCG